MSFFGALSRHLGRPASESSEIHESPTRAMIPVIFIAALSLAVIPFLASFYRSISHATGFSPDAPISRNQWAVLYSPATADCGPDERFGHAACLASPGNPSLWRSPFHRADQEHFKRSQDSQGRDLWVGAELPVSLLQEAHALHANHLVLGWFEGTYDIWVDGLAYGGTQGWHEIEPVTLEIPASRLARPQPLQVAIRIHHDVGSIEPDMMNRYFGGEGFYESTHLQKYRARLVFWLKARPFALFLTYLLLSIAFFFFWSPSKLKKEYFYLAVHTLISAFNQARMMDLFFAGVSSGTAAITRLVLELYSPLFGLFVGLAFARTRASVFKFGLPLAIAAPWVLTLVAGDTHTRFTLSAYARDWVAPACYFLGAAACFLQAWHVRHLGRKVDRARGARLIQFGIGMSALGIFFAIGMRMYWETSVRAWLGYEHFIVLVYLGAIALRDFKLSARLVNRAPVSEYHRRETLPERLSGALLVARANDPHGAGRERLQAWKSQFYSTVTRAGGTIIHRHGEEVTAFFDQSRCAAPGASALRVVDEMKDAAALIQIESHGAGLDPGMRASLVLGAIRPVWENLGGHREPSWEEAGHATAFVEASRLLELGPERPGTVVFLKEETAQSLAELDRYISQGLVERDRPVTDKHGNQYILAIYKPASRAEYRAAS